MILINSQYCNAVIFNRVKEKYKYNFFYLNQHELGN